MCIHIIILYMYIIVVHFCVSNILHICAYRSWSNYRDEIIMQEAVDEWRPRPWAIGTVEKKWPESTSSRVNRFDLYPNLSACPDSKHSNVEMSPPSQQKIQQVQSQQQCSSRQHSSIACPTSHHGAADRSHATRARHRNSFGSHLPQSFHHAHVGPVTLG
jgi:hypothetical protein